MRKFDGEELLIATHNQGKAREISALLSPYVAKFLTSKELNLPEPEETGSTFAQNAALKARIAAQKSGKVALSDDSGLSVSALGGEPGIHSARFAGPDKDFPKAMSKINDMLAGHSDKSASFICALAIGWPDGHVEIFEGRICGKITWPMCGDQGFGYDPFFVPDGYDVTFAQMNPEDKHAISHRADAFKKLVDGCLKG